MTKNEFTGIVLREAMAAFPTREIIKTEDGYKVDGVNVGDIEAGDMFLSIWDTEDARKFAKDYFAARLPMVQ